MSPRLEVRSVDAYRTRDYPGVRPPVAFARTRYSGSVLERMRHRLERPLVVFGLFASLQLGASADDDPPPPPVHQEGVDDPLPGDAAIRVPGPAEIAALVCGLEAVAPELEPMVAGRIAGSMGHLTEEEGRAVLEAFFAKNGFAIERDVRVALPGVSFTADGFDSKAGIGFEFLGPSAPGSYDFQPAETDLTPEAVRELELQKARGDRAVLVLDGRNYAYNVRYYGALPSKAVVIERLVEDVRRFMEWLAREGRLPR